MKCNRERCPREAAPGRKSCEHHLAYQREWGRRRIAQCRAHGPDGECGYCRKKKAAREQYQARNQRRHLEVAVRRFGLTVVDYEELLATQGGVCAICGQTCDHYSRLSIDHCHKSGKVRGLLCNNCNRALGLLRDDPEALQKAVVYLERAS